jgi:hypothetical protein
MREPYPALFAALPSSTRQCIMAKDALSQRQTDYQEQALEDRVSAHCPESGSAVAPVPPEKPGAAKRADLG